ncbi:HNH endonuclease [Mycobacterium sp. SMC-8]|uniref:HNH endonuclease signature motif containing protein n=1 Tax=Mycobacterium sp. SMC-8 TaxID=2857060 RepID=UPI0021B171C5|nr:HNH endonuclease signature motif containing protein [Mycobacterium sp. SMC-8]UXA10851.1 HNH endonuclease [Mycobacterium sp. SMC-8]
MFDRLFAGVEEPALLAAIEECAREEAQAGARKAAAIAELVYSTVDRDDEHDDWVYDCWAQTASELGAVLNLGHRRASGQMRIAMALRDRLPGLAERYLQGRVSAQVVSKICWRTRLVEDAQVWALLDEQLATHAPQWGSLSEEALVRAIDAVIDRYDPDARIRSKEVIAGRDFHIGAHEDPDEWVLIWGQILGCDAVLLAARIAELLKNVCADDPRDMGERRSCAVGAIIRGQDHLPCRCGKADCPGAAPVAPGSSNVVISVLADPAALEAAHDLIAAQDQQQQNQPQSEPEPAEESQSEREPNPAACVKDSGLALLPGVKVLPIVALAEAIRDGAAIKQLWLPGPEPEPHYRPSAKLAAFVRARDLFCRFPGCTVPAEHCDLDHVLPWPYGPTHPSNLNCKCRTHHLAKTFWDGWRDEQLPDGTVIWTTPAGLRYTTVPGSRVLFPGWNTTTAKLPPRTWPPPDPGRSARMPKRRRPRAAEDAARITAEREHNAAQRALEEEAHTAAQVAAQVGAAAERHRRPDPPPPPEPGSHHGDDPPPF